MTTGVLDAIVIGAGMAGLSVAAELARDRRVAVVEREQTTAFHTTGRSAAVYIERYGGPSIAPFNRASRPWFISAAEGAADHPLLTPRGLVVVARPGAGLDPDLFQERGARTLDATETLALFPVLRPEAVGSAVHVPEAADLDVAGAVAAYRRLLRERGGTLALGGEVIGLARRDGLWEVTTTAGVHRAAIVVDAAGAWADGVATLAGLPPVGLRPLRRTIATIEASASLDHQRWPMLLDAEDRYYLKPEPGHFLASPCDETPMEPCDPRPDMLDVATALEHVREATTLEARSVTASWAGLRTFAPDRSLVLGPDPLEPTFVWCAGQGGFGIQASPSAARAIVALVDGAPLPGDLLALGADPGKVSVARFRDDRRERGASSDTAVAGGDPGSTI